MKLPPVAASLAAILLCLLWTSESHAALVPSTWSFQAANQASDGRKESDIKERVRLLVDEVIRSSYPELIGARIRITKFDSKSDYFKARFGLPQFFSPDMSYLISVNPRVFQPGAPADAIRAIIAHELAHILYYDQRNRLSLIGLVRLTSAAYAARFERWADLQAISRGYGSGLSNYRTWLYQNVPGDKLAEKRRNYFSPEEIEAVSAALHRRPELLCAWLKHVPRSLSEIRESQADRE